METITKIENQNLNQNIPQKNIFKPLFFLFLGLFLIILIILIYFLTKTNKPNQIIENIIPTPTLVPTSTPSANLTQDLKTYTNSVYKYSIQYPQNWMIENKIAVQGDYKPENRQFLGFFTSGKVQQDIEGRIDIYNETLSNVIKNNPFISSQYNKVIKSEIIDLNKNKWTKLTIQTTGNNNYINEHFTYLIEKNNNTYQIDGISDYIEEILKNFSFIN